MRRLAFATGLALTLGCAPAPPITVASPSPPAPTPSATPIATATASPSPTESPGPLNIVTAVVVPRSFHYFSVGQGESFRILLFDEDRSQPPAVVLTSGRPPVAPGPDVRSEAISVSADGRVIVVMRRLSEQTTYYLLRPETGEIRELLSGIGLGAPVITADGSRIAYAQSSSDPALNGVWISAVTADRHPAPSRVVSDQPQRVGSPPQPLAWSGDGGWLAISPVLGPGGIEVAVVDPTGGETHFNSSTNIFEGGNGRVLGSGYAVDWRAGEHSLLITNTRDFAGGRTYIYVADVTGGPNGTRVLHAPPDDVTLGPAVW